ncbi:5'-3' exonuclease [Brevibacillus sp. SYSU BS000544]|uniref:5'-3' exonuclease n=1 Tax=Brevibacillus sp. SYSU BS000544 TaxID=3416443 RepID=UPI003CE52CE3
MKQPFKYLLIDGMSFLFRAFYANSWGGTIKQTSTGLYTNAVSGFTKMMLDYVDLVRPTHVIVAWDVAGKETLVRTQWFDGYKATRVEAPVELIPQFDLVKEVVSAFSVPNLGVTGYEGDDILGTVSSKLAEDGHRVVIATGDYDSLQLVNDFVSVKILKNGGKHEHYTPESLLELRGISANQVVEVKALQGDASDCIPGCPGIGEKTAYKLIREHQSLEGLYENLDSLTAKTRSKLEEHKEQIFLSRKLATILCDAPVDFTHEDAYWNFDSSIVREKFHELEFARISRVG